MKCDFCNKIAKSFASKRQHEVRCKSNPNRCIIPTSSVVIEPTKCSFCDKIFRIKNAVSNHERRCPDNPNRIMEIITPAGLLRCIEGGKQQIWDVTKRKKHSDAMKQAVENNPESYTSSNRGRTKQIIYDGIKFQGNWELEFYKWAKKSNILIARPIIGFEYEWNGKRTYFPDFYLSELELYVEIKGYETDRDRAKWDQFPHKIRIIKLEEINKIKKGQTLRLTDTYK